MDISYNLPMKIPTRRINVSKHACTRVMQRFRLFMRESEKDKPAVFLREEFRKSFIDIGLELCPFKKNALQIKHGAHTFKSHGENLTFFCVFNNEEVTIKSVVRKQQ